MPDDRTENGLSAGYGKGWMRAKGSYVVGLLLVAALVALGWREFDRMASATTGEHGRMIAAQDALVQEFRVLSYMLSLPQEARPRLVSPPGFWERVDRDQPRGRNR